MPAVVRSSHAAAPDPEWLVNQIAHALRNPIFAATVQAEALALKARSSDELSRSAAMVQGQLKRLADDIDEMLLLGRPAHLNPRATDLVAVARGVAESFRRGLGGDAASVELRTAGAVPFLSDPDAIRIILERLLRNAVQHTEPPHEVELEVAVATDGAATVSVRDRAPAWRRSCSRRPSCRSSPSTGGGPASGWRWRRSSPTPSAGRSRSRASLAPERPPA